MRRFSLPALHACTTCVVLLIGCQSAVEPVSPTPPPPSAPSLSFEISGPSQIDANGAFTWEAFVFGGSGAYRYQWEVKRQGAGRQITITTGRKLSLDVTDNDGDIVLRLTVTSDMQTSVQSFGVRNCISGCPR
jgi:hypothetical protein